jgi:hypothetical protein
LGADDPVKLLPGWGSRGREPALRFVCDAATAATAERTGECERAVRAAFMRSP